MRGTFRYLHFDRCRRLEMLEKLKEKWDEILLNLKEEHEITDVSFKTWLLPLKVHSINGDTVTVTVPDVEFLGYIRKKY